MDDYRRCNYGRPEKSSRSATLGNHCATTGRQESTAGSPSDRSPDSSPIASECLKAEQKNRTLTEKELSDPCMSFAAGQGEAGHLDSSGLSSKASSSRSDVSSGFWSEDGPKSCLVLDPEPDLQTNSKWCVELEELSGDEEYERYLRSSSPSSLQEASSEHDPDDKVKMSFNKRPHGVVNEDGSSETFSTDSGILPEESHSKAPAEQDLTEKDAWRNQGKNSSKVKIPDAGFPETLPVQKPPKTPMALCPMDTMQKRLTVDERSVWNQYIKTRRDLSGKHEGPGNSFHRKSDKCSLM